MVSQSCTPLLMRSAWVGLTIFENYCEKWIERFFFWFSCTSCKWYFSWWFDQYKCSAVPKIDKIENVEHKIPYLDVLASGEDCHDDISLSNGSCLVKNAMYFVKIQLFLERFPKFFSFSTFFCSVRASKGGFQWKILDSYGSHCTSWMVKYGGGGKGSWFGSYFSLWQTWKISWRERRI